MAIFIPRWERFKDKKPAGLVEIDWNNEISAGLTRAYLFTGSGLLENDIASEKIATLGANVTRNINGVHVSGATGIIDCGTSAYHNGAISISTRASFDSLGSIEQLVAADSSDSSIREFQFRKESDDTISLIVFSGNSVYSVTSLSKITKNTINGIGSGFKNGQLSVFLDGFLENTSTGGSNLDIDGARLGIGGRYRNTTNSATSEEMTGDIHHLYIWGNRYITDDEHFTINENPYQILKPRRKWFVFGGAGAGSDLQSAPVAEVSAAADLNTNIPLDSVAVSVATASGSLSTQQNLVANAAAVVLSTGVLDAQIMLSGSALSSAIASAALDSSINFVGNPIAETTAGAALDTAINMATDATAQATASANLSAGSGLSAQAAAVVNAGAVISTAIVLNADALNEVLATAGLTTASSGLEAAAKVQAQAAGVISSEISLAAPATVVATMDGGLTTHIELQAFSAAAVNVSGGLTFNTSFSVDALVSAIMGGDLTVGSGLTAGALIEALSTVQLSTNIKLQVDSLVAAAAQGALSVGVGFLDNVPTVFTEPQRGFEFFEVERGY